jgi:hypothetical protein
MNVRSMGLPRSLARVIDEAPGPSPGPSDGSHLPASASAAKELIAAIAFQARHEDTSRHIELLQDFTRPRIYSPQIAFVSFPSAVPKLSIDPGDPRDEAAALDGAKNRPALGIDLMDLAVPMLAHPERAFGPGEPGVAASAGRRDRSKNLAGFRIDLLDTILGDLKQVPAVESRSSVRGYINRAERLAAGRIESVELVSGGKPDLPAIISDAMHSPGPRKGPVFANDFSR